jgi:hypothetical protein
MVFKEEHRRLSNSFWLMHDYNNNRKLVTPKLICFNGWLEIYELSRRSSWLNDAYVGGVCVGFSLAGFYNLVSHTSNMTVNTVQ